MEPKPYACELPYPEIEPVENIADSKLLMPNYGGPSGELTAVTTYCFQFYITERNKELKDALEGIARIEMHHHELLGEAIFKLGGYPVMGGRTYWSGSFVNYTLDPKKFLRQNITAEETAILNYERTVLALHTESVKTLLERIILDEELHIKIFKELLAGL
ncbi:MAG: manganese catalase family protein [Christensenellales bacterium]|nr:manganese catalase family protein [Christensenellales bacterium]